MSLVPWMLVLVAGASAPSDAEVARHLAELGAPGAAERARRALACGAPWVR
jgi:hypothetical protein